MKAEQWQELCEWAEFSFVLRHNTEFGTEDRYRQDPDGSLDEDDTYPPQDMNTLFKWMVPKLEAYRMNKAHDTHPHYFSAYLGVSVGDFEHKDPFEALAQAIYRVVTNERD